MWTFGEKKISLRDHLENMDRPMNVETANGGLVWIEIYSYGVYLDGTLTAEELRMIADYLDKKKEK